MACINSDSQETVQLVVEKIESYADVFNQSILGVFIAMDLSYEQSKQVITHLLLKKLESNKEREMEVLNLLNQRKLMILYTVFLLQFVIQIMISLRIVLLICVAS